MINRMITYLLILVMFYPVVTVGKCPQVGQKIRLKDLAPCDGYFFSESAEKKMRESHYKTTQEKDKYKKLLELKDLQIGITEAKVGLWEKEADRQATALQKTKNDMKYGVLIGFGVGLVTILVTGYAMKAVGR